MEENTQHKKEVVTSSDQGDVTSLSDKTDDVMESNNNYLGNIEVKYCVPSAAVPAMITGTSNLPQGDGFQDHYCDPKGINGESNDMKSIQKTEGAVHEAVGEVATPNGATPKCSDGSIVDKSTNEVEHSPPPLPAGTVTREGEDIVDTLPKDVPPRSSRFTKRVSSALSRLDIDSCDPDIVVSLLASSPSKKTYSALAKRLKSADKLWIQGFLQANGVESLLDVVDVMSSQRVQQLADALLLLECVGCVKSVMNSHAGLDYISEHRDSATKLVKGQCNRSLLIS